MKNTIHKLLICGVAACLAATQGCNDDNSVYDVPDYTVSGVPVEVQVAVRLPEMDVKSRAEISDNVLNTVNSLWIRTYSQATGKATSDWKICTEADGLPAQNTADPQQLISLNIKSLSGNTYIVAVANVENMGVKKSDKTLTQKPLSDLLKTADTWTDFLDIAAVMPNTFGDVYAPTSYASFPMSGCYSYEIEVPHSSGTKSPAYNEWGNENFQPYFIPAQSSGTVHVMDRGAIHLRRPVSHIYFKVMKGDDIAGLKVNSYTVFNVPRYAWLYERDAEDGRTANFADDVEDQGESSTYWASSRTYPNQYIEEAGGVATFDFWQTENKHTGDVQQINYNYGSSAASAQYFARESLVPNSDPVLFASLVDGTVWEPNNMASYVRINCTVEYDDRQLHVDDEGKIINSNQEGDNVYRVGEVQYLVHLGYVNNDANDFNCYRNVKYYYNVTVNGVDDVRVDAYTESIPYPGEQGIVSDMTDQKIDLDCHYNTFNIELTEIDLATDDTGTTGFGYLIVAYRGNEQFIFDETTDLTDYDAELYNWIELRAVNNSTTTTNGTLAQYTPATPSSTTYLTDQNATFFLTDMNKKLSAGGLAAGTYTVFVNEYVYEKRYDEEGYGEENNSKAEDDFHAKWTTYVNQDPRRFYIKTTQQKSADGNQIYARSKYGVAQQSIQTYFNTTDESKGYANTIMGVERENENLGLRLYNGNNANNQNTTSNTSRFSNINTEEQNGRYNTALWVSGNIASGSPDPVTFNNVHWSDYLQNIPLVTPAITATGLRNQGGAIIPNEITRPVNAIQTLTGNNYPTASFNDPSTSSALIWAMNSCMNRNRDNNGNGVIDPEELRWYVPTIGQYVRMTLGAISLEEPIMDFSQITTVPFLSGSAFVSPGNGGSYANDPLTRYQYAASNVSNTDGINIMVLWAIEGVSTSLWHKAQQWGGGGNAWNVRCIRNLGTDLNHIYKDSQLTQAYEWDQNNKIVKMTYYDERSIRTFMFQGNGTGTDQLPVHLVSDDYYNSVYSAFEYDDNYYAITLVGNDNAAKALTIKDILNGEDNPCTKNLGGNWRVPNQTEAGIMRNLGIFGTYENTILTCTVNAISNATGKINPNDFTTSTNRPLIFKKDHGLILSDSSDNFSTTVYVRCVRDVRP